MKKRLTLTILVLTITLIFSSVVYADTLSPKMDKKVVIEEYQTIEDIDELVKKAKTNVPLPNGEKLSGKVDGKEVPVYVTTEKVKKLKSSITGEESYIYLVSAITYDTTKDIREEPSSTNEGSFSIQSIDDQDRSWATTRIILRAYYEGGYQDGSWYHRVSKWEAWWDQLDFQTTYLSQNFTVQAKSENPDGDWVEDSITKTLPLQEKWYSQTPWWGSEYLAATRVMGQRGFVEIKYRRGTATSTIKNEMNYGF